MNSTRTSNAAAAAAVLFIASASANAGFTGWQAILRSSGPNTIVDVFAGFNTTGDKLLNVLNMNIAVTGGAAFVQQTGVAASKWKPIDDTSSDSSVDSFVTLGGFSYGGNFFTSYSSAGDPNFTNYTTSNATTIPALAGWYNGIQTSPDVNAINVAAFPAWAGVKQGAAGSLSVWVGHFLVNRGIADTSWTLTISGTARFNTGTTASDSRTFQGFYIPPDPILVPGTTASIQSAIDMVPAGSSRTILVSAGTYSGPIDFKGKNIVVRGAGASSTIINGTGGQSVSVVRMGGEPASAALESVTVRGGSSGTQLPNFPSVLVGGGIFVDTSAASIRNCTIENNAAGFGGGIYLLNCSGTVSGCTVRNNTASTDGGGIQAYQSTVQFTNDVVQGNTANSRGGGMHLVQGTPTLSTVSVTGNQSNNTMGGISWYSVGAAGAMLNLSGCTVTGNNASTGQGGIGATDGGLVTMRFTGTNVCSNLPRPNVVGQWQDLGSNTICDCVGDITVDGRVDGADLGSLLSAWGTCTATCVSDLNRDGKVDGFDLGLLLANWGPCGG